MLVVQWLAGFASDEEGGGLIPPIDLIKHLTIEIFNSRDHTDKINACITTLPRIVISYYKIFVKMSTSVIIKV